MGVVTAVTCCLTIFSDCYECNSGFSHLCCKGSFRTRNLAKALDDTGRVLKSLFLVIIISGKVEKNLKGSLDSIPSPSPSVKIQIMGRKICLRCKGKTLLGVVNKLLKTISLLITPSNVLPLCLKQIFPPII